MKALPPILILVALAAIVTTAFLVRAKPRIPNSTSKKYLANQGGRAETMTSPELTYSSVVGPLPAPASSDESAKAIRAASVKSTLIKYRTAVASGNRRAQEALLPSLKKHAELAISIAEDDLPRATNDSERKSIQGAIEAIRR